MSPLVGRAISTGLGIVFVVIGVSAFGQGLEVKLTVDSTKAPPHYLGIDPQAYVKAWEAQSPEKGQFETTAQHETRMRNALLLFHVGPLGMTDLFPFRPSATLTRTYDADSETASIRIPGNNSFSRLGQAFQKIKLHALEEKLTGISEPLSVLTKEIVLKTSTYKATNGYGASFSVTAREAKRFCIEFPDPTTSNPDPCFSIAETTLDDLVIKFPLKLAIAQSTLSRLQVVLLCAPDTQYLSLASMDNWRSEPTFGDPLDLKYTTYICDTVEIGRASCRERVCSVV